MPKMINWDYWGHLQPDKNTRSQEKVKQTKGGKLQNLIFIFHMIIIFNRRLPRSTATASTITFGPKKSK